MPKGICPQKWRIRSKDQKLCPIRSLLIPYYVCQPGLGDHWRVKALSGTNRYRGYQILSVAGSVRNCPLSVRSRLGCRDLSNKGPNNKHSLEEQFCHLAFATSKVQIVRVAKIRLASKTSKTITAWWLASSLRSTLLAVQCQINDEKTRALHDTADLDCLGHTWGANDWGSGQIAFPKASELTTLHL